MLHIKKNEYRILMDPTDKHRQFIYIRHAAHCIYLTLLDQSLITTTHDQEIIMARPWMSNIWRSKNMDDYSNCISRMESFYGKYNFQCLQHSWPEYFVIDAYDEHIRTLKTKLSKYSPNTTNVQNIAADILTEELSIAQQQKKCVYNWLLKYLDIHHERILWIIYNYCVYNAHEQHLIQIDEDIRHASRPIENYDNKLRNNSNILISLLSRKKEIGRLNTLHPPYDAIAQYNRLINIRNKIITDFLEINETRINRLIYKIKKFADAHPSEYSWIEHHTKMDYIYERYTIFNRMNQELNIKHRIQDRAVQLSNKII